MRLFIFFTYLQGSVNSQNYELAPQTSENNHQCSPPPWKWIPILPRSPKPLGCPIDSGKALWWRHMTKCTSPSDSHSVDIFFIFWSFRIIVSDGGVGGGGGGGGLLHFPVVIINRLNKTESAVFQNDRILSISEGSVFPDYLWINCKTAKIVEKW